MPTIKIGEKVPFSCGNFRDAGGNAASAPVLQLKTTDAAIGVVVDVSADTLSGAVQAVAPGTCSVADDPESGEVTLIGEAVTVLAGEAVSGDVTFGDAVPA